MTLNCKEKKQYEKSIDYRRYEKMLYMYLKGAFPLL